MVSNPLVEDEQLDLELPSIKSVASLRMVGVSHETADIDLRSALAIQGEHVRTFADALLELGAKEAFILSTCNRTSVYFVGLTGEDAIQALSRFSGVERSTLESSIYKAEGWGVVRHLFKVASGLKSAAIGESEILGQLKTAYLAAKEHGSIGKFLDPLIQRTFRAAKRVRSESGLKRRGLSLGSLTVNKAFSLSHGAQARAVLLIGAGQIAESVAKNLHHRDFHNVTVTNRSLPKAAALAQPNGFKSAPLDDLKPLLAQSNIIISAVTVAEPILTEDLLKEVAPGSILIDLGVPSNVSPGAKDRPDLKLLEIDELAREVSANAAQIMELIPHAETLVEEELRSYSAECCERESASCIEALVAQSEEVRRLNLEWALSQIPTENSRERKLLEDLSIRITRGMISKPIKNLKTDFRAPEERAVLARFFEAEV